MASDPSPPLLGPPITAQEALEAIEDGGLEGVAQVISAVGLSQAGVGGRGEEGVIVKQM